MQGSSKKAVKLRQQASVEAEVARSRLALAYRDLENGEKELALRRSVEAAFDAGVAAGYAAEANQKGFNQEMKALLVEAQNLTALAVDRKACDQAYKAGIQYAKARNRNKESSVQDALASYESAIEEIGVGRAANPGPGPKTQRTMSTGQLKAKLLR